jgi:hypothetical protein
MAETTLYVPSFSSAPVIENEIKQHHKNYNFQVLICSFSSLFLQNGLATKVEKSRKQIKERKNRTKKIRGVKKVCKSILFRLLSSKTNISELISIYA